MFEKLKKDRVIQVTYTFIPSYGEDLSDEELLRAYDDQIKSGIRHTIEYLNRGDKYKYSSRVTLCRNLTKDKED